MGSKLTNERGNWICMRSGKRFYPLSPDSNDVDMEDVAHSLSLKCRWGGHCSKFYSVAEHSLRVADVVVANFRRDHQSSWDQKRAEDETRLELFALLHDAHEAYLTDMPKPLKPCLDWKKYEEAVDRAIWLHLGLAWVPTLHSWQERIHRADMVLLNIEATTLFDPEKARVQEWNFSGFPPAPWEATAASLEDYSVDPRGRFLNRFNTLMADIRRIDERSSD